MMDRRRFGADVLEWELPVSVVDALLVDHAVGKAWHNIRWCTKDYERYGIGFGERLISHDTPFGIGTDPGASKRGSIKVFEHSGKGHDVVLYQIERGKRKVSYVSKDGILKNASDVAPIKVFIPEAYGAGENFPHQILGQPELAPQNSVCTQSYLYVTFGQQKEAKNFVGYLKAKFFRVLVLAAKITQHAQAPVYRFVPVQDFSEPWDDAKLYKKYKLTREEIAFIESMIKPME